MSNADANELRKVPSRLRSVRESRGMTLADAAKLTAMSESQVAHLEHGRRQLRAEHIVLFARVYDVSPAMIVPEFEDPELHDLFTLIRRLSPEGRDATHKYVEAMLALPGD